MMGSVVIPARTTSQRKYSYSLNTGGVLSLGQRDATSSAPPFCKNQEPNAPPLPPRRHSAAIPPPPLKLHSVTLSGGMDSRYYRPNSPRGRYTNPARSSTGTFGEPFYDTTYYGKTSPRSSGDRVASTHQPYATYTPSVSSGSGSGSRTSSLKYDSYTGRPRRNTLNESDDRLVRPNVREVVPQATTTIPIRSSGLQHAHHYDRPSSPLARSFDNRGDTYITHAPSRHETSHKRIYSVDDNSHKAKLVSDSRRDYGAATSGTRTYHPGSSKPHSRPAELVDDSYSYTDPASMYRDTEPAWRRPRSGSIERGSRPTSMILERGPRNSARELGPPPSTRGFDKINNSIPRRDPHARSSSIERSREAPKYEPYPEAVPTRSSSTRHHAPAVHQEPREHRRETYHEDYDRRDREAENRRQPTHDRFEDREVATRGFGIAPGVLNPALAHDHHAIDRQPVWNAHETARPSRPEEYAAPYYPDRAEVRMPDARSSQHRDLAPGYEERPRGEERPRERRDVDERGHISSAVPIAAGAAVGAAATVGAVFKSRDKERERERDPDRDSDRERERRREWDERDRRDRVTDDRRDSRMPEERRERIPEEKKEERVPLAAAAYASTQEPERKPRERRYEDDEPDRKPRERRYEDDEVERKPRERRYEDEEPDRKPRERRYEEDGRDRKARRAPSSDGSGDDRPRHYVERDSARENDRRKDPAPAEAPLDPDEEYRRRIQQEAERSGRPRESDSDKERERRRRKDERDRSRDPSRGPATIAAESAHPRYDERSRSVLDTNIVQEPDSLMTPGGEQASKSVQIVAPPKEPEPKPRGILRKPTEKFPEHPDNIREGVAPHKSQLKGKDIPVDARWTKIDRRLVNPQALEEAKERFEERMDCVIVLRVLTKEQIQKLADRTKEIRESREEDEYDRRDRRGDRNDRSDRDRHRSHRDEEDRDRRRRGDYDETDDDDVGRRDYERDRERERGGPRMIEAGR